MWNWDAWLWDFSFLQRCCFSFHLREAWRCVIGRVICDISKDPVCLFLGLIDLEGEGAMSLQNICKHSPSSTVSRLRRLESSDEQFWCENQSILVCNCVLYVLIIKHHTIWVFCCRGDKHVLSYVSLYVMWQGIFLSLLMKQLFWISGQEIWPKCTKSCTACLWERAVRRQHRLWWAVCWIYCPVLSPSCPRSKK